VQAITIFSLTGLYLFKGKTPVEISTFLLREKYFAYAVSIATGVGLLYLYNLGYNHWLYNPALYQLWTYSDLNGTGSVRDES
jgi:hypothetical protein